MCAQINSIIQAKIIELSIHIKEMNKRIFLILLTLKNLNILFCWYPEEDKYTNGTIWIRKLSQI